MWRNTASAYGLVSIVLHWLIAVAILGLFGLGLWMVDLSYYHPWYATAPDIHRAIGVLVGAAVLARLVWRWLNPRPAFEADMARWERVGALVAHWVMYVLMIGVVAAGYLITTAEGDPVSVFGWFQVPALVSGMDRQVEIAGAIHYYGAWALVLIATVHALAALKHHFVDRDLTLVRMLRPGR